MAALCSTWVEIEREKLLSNFEVNQHLIEIQSKNQWLNNNNTNKKKRAFNPNLEEVTKQTTFYFENIGPVPQQNIENITQMMKDLSKFKLEKIEKLQIINSAPQSLVTLYAVIEECDQRFNEQEIEEILQIIQTHFPQQAEDEEEGEGEDQVMEE
ncbi:DNA-directed RNA polymerase III subunit [Wickerhamomyces ciferrii]|uniref:DNA-directed RNA polymerase III subunit RPC9 n=1 Tax=Wickerhamomyces ciferrii (strain ATCC 14091 / BCRC 22168 / CBS 111 / JCM 3599 / NBRC 0793 / NRRL Y-1031 F-60-10) TaxID=1206466 RepID=K0KRT6_WICCF|nr:DNA-directed RNA polymerase III subunit [Wickerhamomyces ciferrii]CCH45831.1 DNA-directed RNA polymerase III subunit [Wickerhamomyces ciferrii]